MIVNLFVLVYHRSNRTKDPFELSKNDVVITTYSIVSMEVPKHSLAYEVDKDKGKRKKEKGKSLCNFFMDYLLNQDNLNL